MPYEANPMYIRKQDRTRSTTRAPWPATGPQFASFEQGRSDQELLRPERASRRPPPPAPTPARKGRTFVTRFHPGVAHNHAPTGRWSDVQADAAKRSAKAQADLQAELAKGLGANRQRIADLTEILGTEGACSRLPPLGVLLAARQTVMIGMPLGQKHLDHYLRGRGADLAVDLADVIRRDAGVRAKLRAAIRVAPAGNIRINQKDYKVEDFRFAFGAIDRLDYEVDRSVGLVHVWFMDRYEWHPVGFGYKKLAFDERRVSNCAHAAAVELKASGASDYWMKGDAVVPLAVVMS
jgi:hypothetical protein